MLAEEPLGDDELGPPQGDAEIDVDAIPALVEGEGAGSQGTVEPERLYRIGLFALVRDLTDLDRVPVDGAARAAVLLLLQIDVRVRVGAMGEQVRPVDAEVQGRHRRVVERAHGQGARAALRGPAGEQQAGGGQQEHQSRRESSHGGTSCGRHDAATLG